MMIPPTKKSRRRLTRRRMRKQRTKLKLNPNFLPVPLRKELIHLLGGLNIQIP
jgi:hypothetical protein